MSPHPDQGVWYAARSVTSAERAIVRPGDVRTRARVVRLHGQPGGGFPNITDVRDWLVERGDIEFVDDGDGGWYRGWGEPFCAVLGSRNDPWEPTEQLVVDDSGAS